MAVHETTENICFLLMKSSGFLHNLLECSEIVWEKIAIKSLKFCVLSWKTFGRVFINHKKLEISIKSNFPSFHVTVFHDHFIFNYRMLCR